MKNVSEQLDFHRTHSEELKHKLHIASEDRKGLDHQLMDARKQLEQTLLELEETRMDYVRNVSEIEKTLSSR